jgi:hypothetical protein
MKNNISSKFFLVIYIILILGLVGITPYFKGYFLSDKKYDEMATFYESVTDRRISSEVLEEYYGGWYSQQFFGKRTRLENNKEKEQAKQYLIDNNLKK